MNNIALACFSTVLVTTAIGAVKTEATKPPNSNKVYVIAEASTAIASGSFVTVEQDHPTEGGARIVEEDGKRYLEIDESFTTAEGPDVQVVMYKDSDVPVNLEEENYLTIAPLQSFSGTQRYELPEELSLDEYQAVAVWCREFNVTFGYASLEQE